MPSFRRPLNTQALVKRMLINALDLRDYENTIGPEIVKRVLSAERGIDKYDAFNQTLDSEKLRKREYKTEVQRWALRNRIVKELVTMPQLENDDDIKLGAGGALPRSEVQKGGEAFLIIGLPAAGKSTLSNSLSQDYGAVILDSDYAKRKLPEFDATYYGASIVNKESSRIIWGFPATDFQDVSTTCFENLFNVVAPRIGSVPSQVRRDVRMMRAWGYTKIHLILISVSKREATIRALRRFYSSGRYVPSGLILDEFGNDPSYCYYYLRNKFASEFDSMGALVSKEGTYKCLDYFENSETGGVSPVKEYEFIDITDDLP